MRLARVLLIGVVFVGSASAWAASPSLGVVLPRGGQRGTTVDVSFQGANLEDAAAVLFHGTGVTQAEITPTSATEVKAKLAIAADCPLGPQAVRVRTKSGLTNLVLFSVGALKEVPETEPNNDAEHAQAVELGSTLNGVVASEDVDYFAVELAEGARLAVEVEGIRLGTALFDPKLRLFGPHGHELHAEDDTPLARQDAAFVFAAKEAGKHLVAISEAAYGGAGNFYYRLHIGTFPRPLSVTPMGGAPGATVDVTWLGDPALATQSVTLPTVPLGTAPLSAQTDAGLSPTPLSVRVDALPSVKEAEPNNDAAQATAGTAPGAFDGVIQEPGDTDWFKFDGKKDQVYDIRLWASALGSPLDSVMTIAKPSGEALSADDDGAGLDSTSRVTLPEDGTYTIAVRDHRLQGGATYAYRIEAKPVERQLEVKLVENEPASLSVAQGNQAVVVVSMARQDFDGPIKLDFPGLPAGVTASADVVPAGQATWPVLLTAAADAPVDGALVDFRGALEPQDAATPLEGHLNQEVVLIYGQNKVIFQSKFVDRLALAVTEPAPFSIAAVQPKVPLVRNANMKLKVVATRTEGFKDAIELRIPWLPTGVGAATATIPAEQTEVVIPVDAQTGAALGKTNIAVDATSAGYAAASPFVSLEVADPWVTFEVPTVETEQGKPVEMVVKVTSAKEYAGSFPAELLGLPKGVTAAPQTVAHGTTELKFPLEVAADAPEGKHGGIFVRTALQAEGEEVLHQSGGGQVTLFKPLPPELQKPAPPPEAPKPDQPERKTRFAQK
ncbi:MAG: PPC domain-containing protein [FCB group bacterium]|jgi:hypothetical protein|nr:PPC domain-containing protein [FCB group bacterium]